MTARVVQVVAGDAHRRAFVAQLGLDIAVPMVLYYGLRVFGASAWIALLAGAIVPFLRAVGRLVLGRRMHSAAIFSLSLMTVGTLVGLIAADPRALMARASWVTAVTGLWILGSLCARRPILFTVTTGFMPATAAQQWEHAWISSSRFRRAMRLMTAGFGLSFVIDAAARVLMAYTLPLDLVPILSNALLAVMLTAVVALGKAYGRQRLADVLTGRSTPVDTAA